MAISYHTAPPLSSTNIFPSPRVALPDTKSSHTNRPFVPYTLSALKTAESSLSQIVIFIYVIFAHMAYCRIWFCTICHSFLPRKMSFFFACKLYLLYKSSFLLLSWFFQLKQLFLFAHIAQFWSQNFYTCATSTIFIPKASLRPFRHSLLLNIPFSAYFVNRIHFYIKINAITFRLFLVPCATQHPQEFKFQACRNARFNHPKDQMNALRKANLPFWSEQLLTSHLPGPCPKVTISSDLSLICPFLTRICTSTAFTPQRHALTSLLSQKSSSCHSMQNNSFICQSKVYNFRTRKISLAFLPELCYTDFVYPTPIWKEW